MKDEWLYALWAGVSAQTWERIHTREVGKPDRRKSKRVGRGRDDRRRARLGK